MKDLDRTIPEVPFAIFSLATEDPDLTYHLRCEELWKEVVVEVCDSDYTTRSHHNVGTYDVGCRGPLCRKAHREHPRRKAPYGVTMQVKEERIYDPVLEFFHTVMKHRVRKYQQDLLKELA